MHSCIHACKMATGVLIHRYIKSMRIDVGDNGDDDDDDDDDVNVMHHLGQRCMSAIVSALQIQTSAA